MRQTVPIIAQKVMVVFLSFLLVLTAVFGGTFALIFTKTSTLINTFLSGLAPTGDLLIRKEVTHNFGDAYVIPDGLSFDFLISLGENYASKNVETSQGDMTADTDGNITVTIAPDEAIRIKDLIVGTSVTVIEVSADGFTSDGGAEKSVTIRYGNNHITYTNIYAPGPVNPVNLTVGGTKFLEGREWQLGDSFTFLLEYKLADQGNVWSKLGETSVTYELMEVTDSKTGKTTMEPRPDFDKFDFTELVQNVTYSVPGEYSFRLSEIDGTIGGITYDKVVSYFDVTVGDADMNGFLEIQNVSGYQNASVAYDAFTGNYHVNVTVNNKYSPVGTATATIIIDKSVMSMSGMEKSAAGYTFELYDESGNLVATSGETSAAGETSIELTFDAKNAGTTFHYTLKETHGGETHNGMIYADTVYPLSVSIVDNLDGTVSAFVYNSSDYKTKLIEAEPEETVPETKEVAVIPEGAGSRYTVSFVNVYDPADTSASFGGTKELTGRDLNEGEFTFDLYATDDNFAVTDGMEPKQTTSNDAEGDFDFAAISYSKVGTYRYVVKEDASIKLRGVTYDESVFRVIVTVTDENGVLKATTTITDELGVATNIKFQNSYQAAATSVTFTGKKTLTGADLTADMFRFLLYKADANYNVQGAALASASNDVSGNFTFDSITCSESGTFYYVVTEDDSAGVEGMTYDDTAYGIKVNVLDDGTGSLKASYTITMVGGDTVEAIVFENSYTKPTNPTNPSTPIVPDVPPTGDESPVELYFALAVISLVVIILLLVMKKKPKNRYHRK